MPSDPNHSRQAELARALRSRASEMRAKAASATLVRRREVYLGAERRYRELARLQERLARRSDAG